MGIPTPSTGSTMGQTLGLLEQLEAPKNQAGTQQEHQKLIGSSKIPCHFYALQEGGTSGFHQANQTISCFLKNALPSKIYALRLGCKSWNRTNISGFKARRAAFTPSCYTYVYVTHFPAPEISQRR